MERFGKVDPKVGNEPVLSAHFSICKSGNSGTLNERHSCHVRHRKKADVRHVSRSSFTYDEVVTDSKGGELSKR